MAGENRDVIQNLLKYLDPFHGNEVEEKLDLSGFEIVPRPLPVSLKVWYLPNGEAFIDKLHSTASKLKELTRSSGYALYLYDNHYNDVYICPKKMDDFFDQRFRWNVEPKKNIAVYVARTHTSILYNTADFDPRFPLGQDLEEVFATYIMAVPIFNFEMLCVGILELYREIDEPYTNDELFLTQNLLKWAGEALNQNFLGIQDQEILNINVQIMGALGTVDATDITCKETIIQAHKILAVIQAYLGTRTASIFLVDKKEIIKDCSTDNFADTALTRKKIRLEKEIDLAKITASSGLSANMPDVFNDMRFDNAVDIRSGLIIRSCFQYPFPSKDNILGIVQFLNKVDENEFSRVDEDIVKGFKNFAIPYYYFKTFRNVIQAEKRKIAFLQELFYWQVSKYEKHSGTIYAEQITVHPADLLKYNFNAFSASPYEMSKIVYYMMKEMFGEYHENDDNVFHYFYALRRCFEESPFNCIINSAQFIYCMVKHLPKYFRRKERISLFLSTFAFCPAHRSPTLRDYKKSFVFLHPKFPFEDFEFKLTEALVEATGIIQQLIPQKHDVVLKMIEENITYTNFSYFLKLKSELLRHHTEHTLDTHNLEHRKLVRALIMMCAVLIDETKNSSGIRNLLQDEIYLDIYKNIISEDIDLQETFASYDVSELHWQFVKQICVPCFELLAVIFPVTKVILTDLKTIASDRKNFEFQPDSSSLGFLSFI